MEDNIFNSNQDVATIDVEDSIKASYLDYSMSVIIGRALPDARDGLKPVHRRILYAMNDLGVGSRSPYKKSARIVGDVIGKYHPHGDTAVYDALVRMAQNFSMRVPAVDGQGNFGSVDGDNVAAMRYIEARMTVIAVELLKDLGKEAEDGTSEILGYRVGLITLTEQKGNVKKVLVVSIADGVAKSATYTEVEVDEE